MMTPFSQERSTKVFNSGGRCWTPSRSSVSNTSESNVFFFSSLHSPWLIGGLLWTGWRLDKLAHQVIPRHPELRPHVRMLHHFRFILPLLPGDEDGLTPLHYYDSGIQLARNWGAEPTEAEYVRCMAAACEIKRM